MYTNDENNLIGGFFVGLKTLKTNKQLKKPACKGSTCDVCRIVQNGARLLSPAHLIDVDSSEVPKSYHGGSGPLFMGLEFIALLLPRKI